MPRFIAHSPPVPGGPPQPLFEDDGEIVAHARAVARLAGAFAEAFGSARVAEWLGWWHDAGKVAPDVQAYLRGETGAKRGLDHSNAGMFAADRRQRGVKRRAPAERRSHHTFSGGWEGEESMLLTGSGDTKYTSVQWQNKPLLLQRVTGDRNSAVAIRLSTPAARRVRLSGGFPGSR